MSTPVWKGTSNSWTATTNWSTGSVPAGGDTAVLRQSAQDIGANLNQSAVTLATLQIYDSFTAALGDATTYLQIGAASAFIGQADGAGNNGGSGRLNVNFGSSSVAVTVFNTGSSATDSYQMPVRLLGSSLTLTLLAGTVGVAMADSETATLTTTTIAGGTLYVGTGATTTTISVAGGTMVSQTAQSVTTLTVNNGGIYRHTGTGTHTTVNVNAGGTASFNGACTITNLSVFGTLDLSEGSGTVTVTNQAQLYAGASIIDPLGRLTFSAGWKTVQCDISELSSLTLGRNKAHT